MGAIDLATGKSYLFAPKLDESYAIWMGKLYTLEDFRNRYEVDVVAHTEQVRRKEKRSSRRNSLSSSPLPTDFDSPFFAPFSPNTLR